MQLLSSFSGVLQFSFSYKNYFIVKIPIDLEVLKINFTAIEYNSQDAFLHLKKMHFYVNIMNKES